MTRHPGVVGLGEYLGGWGGSFISVDLSGLRDRGEQLPWCRSRDVQLNTNLDVSLQHYGLGRTMKYRVLSQGKWSPEVGGSPTLLLQNNWSPGHNNLE